MPDLPKTSMPADEVAEYAYWQLMKNAAAILYGRLPRYFYAAIALTKFQSFYDHKWNTIFPQ